MRVTYDVTKESGSRVQQVLIRDTNNPVGGMRELNVDQIYQIGMPSFISSGAGRFTFMRSIPSQIIPGNVINTKKRLDGSQLILAGDAISRCVRHFGASDVHEVA